MPGPVSEQYRGPDGGGDPYLDGLDAYRWGRDASENPHDTGSELHELWKAGWYDAETSDQS